MKTELKVLETAFEMGILQVQNSKKSVELEIERSNMDKLERKRDREIRIERKYRKERMEIERNYREYQFRKNGT